MRKWAIATVGLTLGATAAATAPIIPTEMRWLASYETIAFDTPSKDLGLNQYAQFTRNDEDGTPYLTFLVRLNPNTRQFLSTTSPDAILGKQRVPILAMKTEDNPSCIGCAYYSEFATHDGRIIRVPYEKKEYDALRYSKSAPQPSRTEALPLVAAMTARAAITFDAAISTANTSVSSLSYSHTTGASATVLLVGANDASNDGCAANPQNVTAVTFNSASLTQINQICKTGGGADAWAELWSLDTPSIGTFTVAVTYQGTVAEAQSGAISLNGAAGTNEAQNTGSGASKTITVNVTTVTDGAWVIDSAIIGGGTTSCSIGADQTSRWTRSASESFGGGSTEPKATAGAVTMSWINCDTTNQWGTVAAAFAPSAPPAATPTGDPGTIWFGEE